MLAMKAAPPPPPCLFTSCTAADGRWERAVLILGLEAVGGEGQSARAHHYKGSGRAAGSLSARLARSPTAPSFTFALPSQSECVLLRVTASHCPAVPHDAKMCSAHFSFS
jgi:hypothetical protein